MGIALHPSNRDFSLGGTQDNGTNVLKTGPTWNRVDGGDGGFTLIDQNATDTTNVVMYHTFFNSKASLVGYAESDTAGIPVSSWNFRGCGDGTTPANGINCTDDVNFYAPLAQGPGNPNTVYYGTDRVYRSADKGVTNTVVSQAPLAPIPAASPPANVPISSIAIAPQDDNFRLVGLNNGALFYTTSGSSALTSLDPVGAGSLIPDRYIGRVLFDPNAKNTAYIALGGYMGNAAGSCVTAACSHIWKVTSLSGSPVLTAINGSGATGLPDIPINALVVDPVNPNILYAGTDIGVYNSADGGVNWNPYGTGLPRVAVFGMGIQPTSRTLRIATHGRGMWEIPAAGPTATFLQFSLANYNANEGDIGVVITVNRTGDTSGASTVDFATSDGTAKQKSDYEINNGTLSFAAGDTSKTFKVLIEDDAFVEGTETLNLALSNPSGANLIAPSTATITIADNDSAGATAPASKQFVANLVGAEETPPTPNAVNGNGGIVQLDAAETSAKVSLIFSGLSSGETAAHIHMGAFGSPGPIIFPLPTTNPVTNFVINPTMAQVVELRSGQHYMNVHSTNFPNGEIRGQLRWNPMEEADLFVRQAYFDFLSRSPDAGGLAFWTGKITVCQSDVQCLRDARIDVSNQFYAEQEFQQTGAVVYRLYRASYGNNQPFPNPNPDPLYPNVEKTMPAYPVFVADRARLTGSSNLAQSQLDLATAFVQRPEFLIKYPATQNTAALFVDAVLATIQSDIGVNLNSERNNLITNYTSGGRALVMFHLANDYWNKCAGTAPCLPAGFGTAVDNRPLIDAEYNRAFVLTEYWGYLRRNPDLAGFTFWLGRVNSAPLRDLSQQRRMVCVFATSAEFQNRFGPVASRNNNECQ